jgi:glutathione synthase
MDPLSQLNLPKDTTVGFMTAAVQLGHEMFYCTVDKLFIQENQCYATVTQVDIPSADQIVIVAQKQLSLAEFDAVWMRKDPPVDQGFIHSTYLLDFANTLVINPPQMLRNANEKLYALHFPKWIPKTKIASDVDLILGWIKQSDLPLIVKPLDGHGGAGVFLLSKQDRNARSALEQLTQLGQKRVVIQEYLEAARIGDKRVILLDGEVKGVILRTPQEDDHRGNIHVGGTVSSTLLTEAEQALCLEVGQRLKQDGLFFVGLDLIGERLTEVNITSPTGIREVKSLYQIDIATAYIEALVQKVNQQQKP